jgi:hypothetical protein
MGREKTKATATASKSSISNAHSALQGTAIAKSIGGNSTATDTGGGFSQAASSKGGSAQHHRVLYVMRNRRRRIRAARQIQVAIYAQREHFRIRVAPPGPPHQTFARPANASDAGSMALATCIQLDRKVTVTASGGGKAPGSDTALPVCAIRARVARRRPRSAAPVAIAVRLASYDPVRSVGHYRTV